ncbi:autophagy 8 [Neocallimastix lanati (nom. inval.)]|nr:autophagy 8 [Neocallimastix sp. JGI-2020a]
MSYQKQHSFEKRQMKSKQLSEKYPDKIPCIVEKVKNSEIMDIEDNKFLIPNTYTFGQFKYIIRKRIKLQKEEALYIFIGEIMPNDTEIMSSIYEKYKNEDGFLYITYGGESTFG